MTPGNTTLQVSLFFIPDMSVPWKSSWLLSSRLVWPVMRMAALPYTQYTLTIRPYKSRPDHLRQNLQTPLIDSYLSSLDVRTSVLSYKLYPYGERLDASIISAGITAMSLVSEHTEIGYSLPSSKEFHPFSRLRREGSAGVVLQRTI